MLQLCPGTRKISGRGSRSGLSPAIELLLQNSHSKDITPLAIDQYFVSQQPLNAKADVFVQLDVAYVRLQSADIDFFQPQRLHSVPTHKRVASSARPRPREFTSPISFLSSARFCDLL